MVDTAAHGELASSSHCSECLPPFHCTFDYSRSNNLVADLLDSGIEEEDLLVVILED